MTAAGLESRDEHYVSIEASSPRYFGGMWASVSTRPAERDLREFALGGRSIPWWACSGRSSRRKTSAATFLGKPARLQDARLHIRPVGHRDDPRRVIIAYTFSAVLPYRVQSIYEFLTVRFGEATKKHASAIFLFRGCAASVDGSISAA